jgi:hypothetical protein
MTPMVEALRDATKTGQAAPPKMGQAPGVHDPEPVSAPGVHAGASPVFRAVWTVMNVSYASTRDGIDGHAESLGRVVDHLDPR